MFKKWLMSMLNLTEADFQLTENMNLVDLEEKLFRKIDLILYNYSQGIDGVYVLTPRATNFFCHYLNFAYRQF